MEADLEVIAPPGWEAVPRRQVRTLSLQARAAIAAAVVLAGTLAGDVYAAYRITSVRAAERLTAHLAEAQALERLRSEADQELRVRAMFPEDIASYNVAVKALGAEHADRVAALVERVRGVRSVDDAVGTARRELASALGAQERSIRSEIEHYGTLYDTLAEEFEDAVNAVERARRRWGIEAHAASLQPFASIEPTLAQWRKLVDVPTGIRLVLVDNDLTVVDLDTGVERTLSESSDVGRVFGHWGVLLGDQETKLVDLRDGSITDLGMSHLVPGPDGTTGWLMDEHGVTAVEVRLPDSPTGKRFDGWLVGDSGRHLVVFQGDAHERPNLVLHDPSTHAVVRRLDDADLLGVGRDAVAWSDRAGRLHLLTGGAERVIEFPDGHMADNVAFSPDGKTAAVTTNIDFAAAQVWLVPDGAAPQAVHAISTARYYSLSWAPRGDWLVAGDGRRYYAVSAADRTVHRIRMRSGVNAVVGVAP